MGEGPLRLTDMKNLSIAFRTYKGVDSGNHEDAFLCQDNLFIVAEGLGDPYLSGIAKERVCQVIYQSFIRHLSMGHSPREALISALDEANRDILRQRRKAGQKMGASISVAYIRKQIMYFTHLGDSRIYSLYGGEINQLTRDHTVEEDGRPGESTKSRKPRPLKALTEGLGLYENPGIEVKKYALREKDIILMTTDGLTNNVSGREILRLSSKPKNLNTLCDDLIAAATRGAWEGNVTAGLIQIEKLSDYDKKNILAYSSLLLFLLLALGGVLFIFSSPKQSDKQPRQLVQDPQIEMKNQKAPPQEEPPEIPDAMPARKQSGPGPVANDQKPVPRVDVHFKEEISAFVTHWKEAWENTAGETGDMESYLSFYSESFSSRGLEKRGWVRDKSIKNREKRWIKIKLTNIRISQPITGRPIEVRFSQNYRSSNYSIRSKKILLIEKETEGWKIIRESGG